MKHIKTSRQVLSLLLGSLLAVNSSAGFASDDELLTFVSMSNYDAKKIAPQPSLSAKTMASMLAKNSQQPAPAVKLVTEPVKQVVIGAQGQVNTPTPATRALRNNKTQPVTLLPAAPLQNHPVPTRSVPANQPVVISTLEQQRPAPISQATSTKVAGERESRLNAGAIELPQFRPASKVNTPAKKNAVIGVSEPNLTPQPRLSVAAAPASVASASPKEKELRALFYNAVMTALNRSPQVRSTRLQVDAAKEDVSNAKGQRWPQVDLTSNSRSYEFGSGNRNASDSNMPSFGVNVATNLIDFGQTSNTIKSKEFSVKAADYQNEAQIEDLAWQVSNGLIELSKQRLIIDMSKQYVARMQELVTMLSGIVESDQGRRSELTQATGRFLQAQSALDNAVAKARDTEIQLYRLLGESQVPLPLAMQWQLHPAQLERLLGSVDKHPVLAQAEAQTQASFAEADALKSSGLPKVNWVVSKYTGKDYYGREQAWQTGINVSWGLFRGGSAKAAEQAAVQRAAAMREQAENQRDDLHQRVRAADQDARSMLQRADLYRNLTRETDRIRLDFFDQWYHLGKRTLLDVLSAESDYYNNRVAEVTNRFDGYSAIFRGYASAGQLVNWLKEN